MCFQHKGWEGFICHGTARWGQQDIVTQRSKHKLQPSPRRKTKQKNQIIQSKTTGFGD